MSDTTSQKINWDLSPLFSCDADALQGMEQEERRTASKLFAEKWEKRTDWLSEPKILRQALDEYEVWEKTGGSSGKSGYYIGLRQAQEEDNPHLKALANKIENESRLNWNKVQFFTHRLAKVTKDIQEKFLQSKELEPYKHFLELLFVEAKYLLSEPEEKILVAKGGVSFGKWVELTSSFLSREERSVEGTKKTVAELVSLSSDTHKKIRDEAAQGLNDVLRTLVPLAEAEINAILEDKRINDELRGIERPDLGRHLADDVQSEVVDSLLSSVEAKNSIAHRFYALKAQLLGVPKLLYHERNIPYGSLSGDYTHERSVALVKETFEELDSEFAEIFNLFIKEGRFDVFPQKGKSDGAFCASGALTHPTYILLNHTNRLQDVLTLAHETGHGINNEFMRRHCHALSFGSPLSTAEVASTFMEDFVLEKLAQKATDEERLAIYMMKLNDDVSTIFRQVACYRFEQSLHKNFREKGYLSKEDIGALFRTAMEAYMGDKVEQSPGSENWWVYWGHIRRFFYVYSYASGLLISKAMQGAVKKDKSFITQVKGFLGAGQSASPSDIFKKLSIDILDQNFWQKGLFEIEHLLEETEALAKKLGKIN